MSLQRPTIPPSPSLSPSPHSHSVSSSFQSPRTAPPPPPPRKRTSSFSVSLPSLSPNPRPAKAPRTEMHKEIHTGARSPLRRTESYVTLPGLTVNAHTNANDKELPTSGMGTGTGLVVPYHRTLRCYKEQRERRKALIHRYPVAATVINNGNNNNTNIYAVPPPIPIQIHLPPPPSPVPSPYTPTPPTPLPRTSSPLCPTHHTSNHTSNHTSTLSSTYTSSTQTSAYSHSPTHPRTTSTRPPFPRSKPEPDLYRKAIVTRMRCTPEGQKILHMGPRLALSIMTATRELERIVGRVGERERERERVQRDGREGREREGKEQKWERVNGMGERERGQRGDKGGDGEDVSMSESGTPVLSSSWVVVPGEDWEMVDCSA